MTREIKFRAKRVDNRQWSYGGLIQCDDFCIIDQHNELYVEEEYNFRGDTHFFKLSGVMCDKKTICQYTGLKDKNDVEIYEGDILSISEYFNNGLITFGRNENLDSFSLEELKGSLISKKREVVTCEEAAMVVGDMYLGALFADMRKSMPIFEFEVIGNIYDNKDLLED